MSKPSPDFRDETRARLLEAAGEIFAEKGFRSATVREICDRAKANVAAVNYHFRDKQGLYTEVLRVAHRSSTEKYPPGLGEDATPAERLQAFVRSFLLRIFDHGQPAWLGKLMSREIMEPTEALDTLIKDVIRPRWHLLESIVTSLAGKASSRPAASREDIRLAVMSIVGQCLFYFHSRPIIDRLLPQELHDPRRIERLANHITRFSLFAIEGLGRRGRAKGTRRKNPRLARSP